MFDMVDPFGLPERFAIVGWELKANAATPVFAGLNILIESATACAPGHTFSLTMTHYLQEDEAWFGPVGFLILFPAILLGLFFGIKKKEPIRLSIFLAAVGFLICDVLFRPGWDPYQGRYFIPVVLIAAPLLALWIPSGWRRWLIGTSIIILSIMVLYKTTFSNPAKPLRNMENLYPPNPKLAVVWGLDRIEKISLQSGSIQGVCRLVEEIVPTDARLGIATTETYYQEYCFFGENFTRALVPIYPPERVEDVEWLLDEEQIEFLLVKTSNIYPAFLPAGFSGVAKDGEWNIYQWVGAE
jgi:hypothetical protein